VDETNVLVGGQWKYLYLEVHRLGQTTDFLRSLTATWLRRAAYS
jgi:transposase-like protein